jgi:hypothetical protein
MMIDDVINNVIKPGFLVKSNKRDRGTMLSVKLVLHIRDTNSNSEWV